MKAFVNQKIMNVISETMNSDMLTSGYDSVKKTKQMFNPFRNSIIVDLHQTAHFPKASRLHPCGVESTIDTYGEVGCQLID